MTKVSHNVSAFQDTLQEVILIAEVVHVALFGQAKIGTCAVFDKLILESMNSPSDMSGESTIRFTV